MKIISKNSGSVEIEASWAGELKGFNGFPDGKKEGSGKSVRGNNGVTIYHWQGFFTTTSGDKLSFKGHDMSKKINLSLFTPILLIPIT